MRHTFLFIVVLTTALRSLAYNTVTSDKLNVWATFPNPIVADGTTVNYLTVYQHDDDNLDYTAFNMEFILPQGFRVNKVKDGRREVNDIKFSARADVTHTISCNLLDGVDLRIIGDSSENANFYKDDEDGKLIDELFTVGLIAESTIPSGDYEVEMKGIVFVHKNGDAKIPLCDPTTYNILIKNPDISSDIEEISADLIDTANCFDLMGRKIDPNRVHNMIVISNGRKYYVK